jgi:hypothetical protein
MRALRGIAGARLLHLRFLSTNCSRQVPFVPSDTALLKPHCPVLRPFVPIANLAILPAHGKSCPTL